MFVFNPDGWSVVKWHRQEKDCGCCAACFYCCVWFNTPWDALNETCCLWFFSPYLVEHKQFPLMVVFPTARLMQCSVHQGPMLYSVLCLLMIPQCICHQTVWMSSPWKWNEIDDWPWWLTKNNLILNVSKAKCIVFALRRENQLCISSKGSWIKQVTEAKLLGVTIDGQLSWHNHVDKIIGKMGKRNNYKRWSSLLTPSASLQVIQALVLFHLVYCPAVWSGAANKELHKLQLVQDRAACLALRTKCTLVFLAESGRWFKNNPTACTHG